MTDTRELRYILENLHRYKRGIKPIQVSVTRKRGTADWSYRDPLFGASVLKGAIADEMIARGWCKLIQLDADTDCLTTTEQGQALMMESTR